MKKFANQSLQWICLGRRHFESSSYQESTFLHHFLAINPETTEFNVNLMKNTLPKIVSYILITLFLPINSFAEGPLQIPGHVNWEVIYRNIDVAHTYILHPNSGNTSQLIISAHLLPIENIEEANKKIISMHYIQATKNIKNEEVLEIKIQGKTFKGSAVVTKENGDVVSSYTLLSDGKLNVSCNYYGNQEDWVDAINILKSLKKG